MARKDFTITGFGVPFYSVSSALDVNDGSATGSDYEQSGPRPGVAVARDSNVKAAPIISGQQGSNLEVVTLSGGLPYLSLRNSLCLGYRFDGESNAKTRGWNPPNVVTSVNCLVASATPRFSICKHPTSSNLLISYADGAGGNRYVLPIDVLTQSAGTPVSVASYSGASDIILSVPKTGRILQLTKNRSWRSDDEGLTWVEHSRSIFPDETSMGFAHTSIANRGAAISNSDSSILYIGQETGSTDIVQLSSVDELQSFSVVDTENNFGSHPCVEALEGGGFVVAYADYTTRYARCRILPTATSKIGDAKEITIADIAAESISVACDTDGFLVAFITNSSGDVLMYASMDGGNSWSYFVDGPFKSHSSGTIFPVGDRNDGALQTVWSGGSVYLLHNSATTAAPDQYLWLTKLGGWSNLTTSAIEYTGTVDLASRCGSGASLLAINDNTVYYPLILPASYGWTRTSAGTGAQSLTGGYLDINCPSVTGTNYYEKTPASATSNFTSSTIASLSITNGGASGTDEIMLGRIVSNGSSSYYLKLRFTGTGIYAYDGHAGTLQGSVTGLTLSNRFEVAIRTSNGTCGAWYKMPDDIVWTELFTGSLSSGSATSDVIRFGHLVTPGTTSRSRWYFVTDLDNCEFGSTINNASLAISGRPISGQPTSLSLETGIDGYGPAYLSCNTGPGALNEIYDVDCSYDYPLVNIFSDVSPSPSRTWRSTTTAEQIIAYDFGDLEWQGDAVVVPFINVNFKTAYLEVYSGGAWSTLATYNGATDFDGALEYVLAGNTIYPKSSSAAGDRFIYENELAGGWVMLGGTKPRRIVSNSPGVWAGSSSSAQKVRIILSGLDGTESATGSLEIVCKSGLLVMSHTATSAYRRWRIRIPTQTVPDTYFFAGIMMPYQLRGITGCDWGWSQEVVSNTSKYVSRYGTTSVKKNGPQRRTLTIGWQDGVVNTGWRVSSDPDFLAVTGSNVPIGTFDDVAELMVGLAEQCSEVPVVVIQNMPASDTTLTDRTRWIYGRLEGSVKIDNVGGTEGTSDVVRVGAVNIVEEV